MDPKSLLKQIYDSATDFAIITHDKHGAVTTWNAGAERITGFAAEEAIGRHCDLIFTPEDRENRQAEQEMETARVTGRSADYRWHVRKDCTRFWADGALTPLRDESGNLTGYLKILKDITEKRQAEMERHHLANFDHLTGLMNRASFDARLGELIAMSVRNQRLLILQVLNLDYFQEANDSLGHQGADALLQQVAQRLRHVMRDSDMVARLSGDEFAIVQPDMPSVQSGGDVADKLLAVLSEPFQIAGQEVLVGGSMGIAICPNDADTPDVLVKKANLALLRAKNEGRGCFRYFTERIDKEAHRRSRDVIELRRAVQNRQFRLEYQPKVDSCTGRTIAVEALLRSTNPVLSRYSVDYLVTLASETGSIQSITLWVMREACAQLAKWKTMGAAELRVCINLRSKEIMDPYTMAAIDDILKEFGLHPSDIEIEITERDAMDVTQRGIGTLDVMRSRGFHIALDDFGTGYSALSYLTELPISSLKLDKSFLQSVPGDNRKSDIARAVIGLARILNLEVIAEGVEDMAQAEFLRFGSCTAFQGFLFSRPLSGDRMTAWLVENADVVH